MWKKQKKYSVFFADGSSRSVKMTPEMAKQLQERAVVPTLVVAK